ncbi:Uncharacterized protein APZ42_020426 [Daphnia magna]|uniref:Uncharacterized protein n=1 Tax=Daphnia magna TaxID=35525 RepID=A0A164XGV0_9CRUS|nr:Uncharacterized protein APZ42_020426 [Daphnia magna]
MKLADVFVPSLLDTLAKSDQTWKRLSKASGQKSLFGHRIDHVRPVSLKHYRSCLAESPIVPEDQVARVNPPAHKTHPDGIGHQVISKGSLALAVSLPSINNFHSDAELEELRPSEEEISGLRSNSPKRPEQQRRVTKLKRRKAYYRHKKDVSHTNSLCYCPYLFFLSNGEMHFARHTVSGDKTTK